jgi:hypothetical protein
MSRLHVAPATRPSPPSRRVEPGPRWRAMGLALSALTLAAPLAAQAPSPSPPPPPPAPVTAPAVLRPPAAPPPPAAAPTPAPAVAASRAPTETPVLPPERIGRPPDSARPSAPVRAAASPANAVALCADGSFMVPPRDAGACGSHGGLRLLMPPRAAAPPRPLARVAPSPAAIRAAVAAEMPAPSGASMRCRDGTYLTGAPAQGRCDPYGGVAAIIPAPREPPPPPARVRRP